ncbi:MAG: TonB-dependent receptor [Bacteroidales bacterium]|nr:TonB-dependent receptor [Candidatus Cryptobacteroides aphodequi]
MKRFILTLTTLLAGVCAFAQVTGGITAQVVNRAGRAPIQGARVEVSLGGETVAVATTDAEGKFLVPELENGSYTLIISADEFTSAQVNAAVEKGFVRDLVFIALTEQKQITDVDDSNFAEFDLQDTGYSDSPTILFGSNDPFTSVASYGFSSVRFKTRGYNSEAQDVLLAGVKMNDAITGYSPFSLWSGLNEAMRSKDSTEGLDATDAYAGRYNGVTNIAAVPSAVRPGWRFSVLSNSALYRLRLMATYASGQMDNGWSYAVNASIRMGGNDWVEGVYYKSLGLYAGAEKKINNENRLALFAFVTPGERGAQNASTQEVYDLMGDNMYNSNWGYQNGKVRNSRVRRTFEPVIGLKYDYTPSHDFNASATLLWRTGRNGYTALDWYDAMAPRPDYYRNLPSYFKMDDSDYNRNNLDKAEWAEFAWTERGTEYNNYQHLNWDRLYNVNYNNPDGRSKYALEERHVDQNDVNLAGSFKWRAGDAFTLTGGTQLKLNRTENYKIINDLLGGEYYMNIDQFAERDFASNEALVQNDLDYFLAHGEAEKILKGGKYGYDYLAQVRRATVWANGRYENNGLTANLALTAGYESFWREGLVRKGLFAGLDENGNEISYGGKVLTSYDANGKVISSYGKSDVSRFLTYSAKGGVSYAIRGGHRLYANVGYFADAPTFNQAFISARTRNSIVDGLTTIKTFSGDVNYQYNANGWNARVTAYYTTIKDQTDVMSFYDDSQQSFTNFAMTGIDQRHMGIEAGVKVPTPVQGLTVSGVLSLGEYIYTSTPHMVQTVDNSSEIVRNEDVPYWKSSPIYQTLTMDDGTVIVDEDADGNPIVKGEQKHYVPSTPQLAAELALNYNINYWFLELNGQYFAHSYLDMNPLYRTTFAVAGGDGIVTPDEVMGLTSQEEFAPAFLLNLSIGKSWYRHGNQIGFSFNANNLLNNKCVKTGGYEQTRLIKSEGKDRYYAFDPKYFYMQGINYMLNIYFRF